MWNQIEDLTLPAHDPTFPKPLGLLPVPPEVEESVASEEARFAREHDFRFAPEARKRMTDDMTLHYYYEGSELAYRINPEGVEVLAVGWDEVKDYLRNAPPEQRHDVWLGPP